MITSFNEWHEDTQIEPTAGSTVTTNRDDSPSTTDDTQGDYYADYGYLFLDILSEETSILYLDPLSGALDTPLIFTTGGDAEWFRQTAESIEDGDGARSGRISHDQESWLQTTVNGAGMLSFSWRVSSEESYDFLEFCIDGLWQDRTSGSVDWQEMIYEFAESGSHSLEWRYVKDASMDSENDCGWLDGVVWMSAP